MRSLITYIIPAVVIGMVVTSPAPLVEEEKDAAAKRASSSCTVNGRVYQPGEIFSLPSSRCIKYRCLNGGYDFYEEGCDLDGECFPVGHTKNYRCRPYRCDASVMGQGKYYSVTPVGTQLCEDYYGQCRSPGEKFIYNMRGRVSRNCSCRVLGDRIEYTCNSYTAAPYSSSHYSVSFSSRNAQETSE
ncbi:uncharacterized protein [Littorina saxatilis]|uniref:Uncharacterized protein n=1 Tax=Littorina saxatilis TaxID=31220 RepID=A0AAN9BWN0_9CAEN